MVLGEARRGGEDDVAPEVVADGGQGLGGLDKRGGLEGLQRAGGEVGERRGGVVLHGDDKGVALGRRRAQNGDDVLRPRVAPGGDGIQMHALAGVPEDLGAAGDAHDVDGQVAQNGRLRDALPVRRLEAALVRVDHGREAGIGVVGRIEAEVAEDGAADVDDGDRAERPDGGAEGRVGDEARTIREKRVRDVDVLREGFESERAEAGEKVVAGPGETGLSRRAGAEGGAFAVGAADGFRREGREDGRARNGIGLLLLDVDGRARHAVEVDDEGRAGQREEEERAG